jgi:hypothetical protein
VDDSTDASNTAYDMMIGRDMMNEESFDISFTNHDIPWEGISIPMKTHGTVTNREVAHELMLTTNEGKRLKDSTSRAERILDSNYIAQIY